MTTTGGRPQSIIAETAISADELLILTPSRTILADTIAVLFDSDRPASAQVLSTEDVVEAVFDEFVLASQTAELHAADRVRIRGTAQTLENSLLVSDDSVTAVVAGGSDSVGISAETPAAVERVQRHYQQYWRGATPVEPQTPPLSELQTTLRDQLGAAVADDLTQIVTAATPPAQNGAALSGVTTSLLAAANNEALLYELSKWGESVGLASKATFSRTKSQLEDAGVIATEKVPVDVGRPRLRLCRGTDQPADPVALANRARAQLRL